MPDHCGYTLTGTCVNHHARNNDCVGCMHKIDKQKDEEREKRNDELLDNYGAKDYCACPLCGSAEIEGSGVEVDDTQTSQVVTCTTCKSEWREYLSVSGLELIADNTGPAADTEEAYLAEDGRQP